MTDSGSQPAFTTDPRLTLAGNGTAGPTLTLTEADVREFQEVMRKECGLVLDDAEARNRAIELVALFRMLLGPIPEDPASEPGSNVVAVAPFVPGKLS